MLRLVPPPAEEDSLLLILHVNVQQMNSSNLTCVELLCSLEGLSPEQVNFTWTRGSKQFLHQNSPSNMSSMLKLCKPDWRHGDTVTCSASYSSNHTVYSKSITLRSTDNEHPYTFPTISAIIFSIFIFTVTFIWMTYCIYSQEAFWAINMFSAQLSCFLTVFLFCSAAAAELIVQQTNSSNLTCVELLCSLKGLSQEQVNFTWTRGSEQLLHQNSPSNMSSTLKLCKPDWRDGDTVTCSASSSSNHTVYSKSITIKCSNSDCTETGGVPWLLIGSVVGVCVVLFFIILCVVSYKCKKKKDGSGSIVFTNKIYENLSFFSPRVSAEPGVGLTPRTHARPNPQGECQPQREECIYEN
ncbi:hypothetical protein NFI96_016932 [Prochilodus magdalenae]|nr:hypothetical protein NFI96_016932 [Prochilodus magdalenae]